MGPPLHNHSTNSTTSQVEFNRNSNRNTFNRSNGGRLGFSAPQLLDIPENPHTNSNRRAITLSELFNRPMQTQPRITVLNEESRDEFKVPKDEHPLKYITDVYLKEMAEQQSKNKVKFRDYNQNSNVDSTEDIISRLSEWQRRIRTPADGSFDSFMEESQLNMRAYIPIVQEDNILEPGAFERSLVNNGAERSVSARTALNEDAVMRRSGRRSRHRNYFDMFLRAYNDIISEWSGNNNPNVTANRPQPPRSRAVNQLEQILVQQNNPTASVSLPSTNASAFHVRIPVWVCDQDRQHIVRTVNSIAGLIDTTIRSHQRQRQADGLDPHDEDGLLQLPLETNAIQLFHTASPRFSSASLVSYIETMINDMARAFRRHARVISSANLIDPTPQRLTIYIVHERTASNSHSAGIRRVEGANGDQTSYLSWRSRLNRLQQRLEAAQDTFNSGRYRPEPSLNTVTTSNETVVETQSGNEADFRRTVRRRLILEDDLE